MRAGEIVFTGMERVVFGRPAAKAVADAADRLGAKRVFILAGKTLNRHTDAVRQITEALGQLSQAAQQTVDSLRQSSLALDGLNQVSSALSGGVSRFKLVA